MELPYITFFLTFFMVSISPGLCMTLALTLGISHGLKLTLWMMIGEMLGVALVALLAVSGVAAIMSTSPLVFKLFSYIGAAYLVYCAYQLWRQHAAKLTESTPQKRLTPRQLFIQGLITAIANPKGWAFMLALLPPFIQASAPIMPQLALLISIICVCEFIAMTIYATGGSRLNRWLAKRGGDKVMFRASALVIIAVAISLVL